MHPLLSTSLSSLLFLPSPSSISYWWNLGSLLSFCLILQLITGVFLCMYYSSEVSSAFNSVAYISREVNWGWSVRMAHANGASAFFVCLYLHVIRGLYFGSFMLLPVWAVGVSILILAMASAFLGYVLPWGQMSFWGASVITNLFSAIPLIGTDFVIWLWGGLSVSSPTLSRFFAFHFLLPFMITVLAIVHMIFLHETGSSNPLGLNSNLEKLTLFPLFLVKDLLGTLVFMLFFFLAVFFAPWSMGDPENFLSANPFVTPTHIQPEWYFLFAYAVLRAIPNKLGGVLALVMSVMVLYLIPLITPLTPPRGNKFSSPSKLFLSLTVCHAILLTWIGARPVEYPYTIYGQAFTVGFFSLFVLSSYWKIVQWKTIYPVFSA